MISIKNTEAGAVKGVFALFPSCWVLLYGCRACLLWFGLCGVMG